MTDEELVEALRQTFHDNADALKPSSAWVPSPRPRSRRVPRPGRRFALASLATALAAAAAAAIVALNDHPSPAHNVSIAGPSSTVAPPNAAAKPTPATSSPVSSSPPTSAPPVTAPPIPVPTGFQPLSVTFVSAHTGWVLGTAPCAAKGGCATLVSTRDGGTTWTEVSKPPITIGASYALPTVVRFANLDDGWIVVPSGDSSQLWATNDGGQTWAQQANPRGSSAGIPNLEASNGLVHIDTVYGSYQVYTSPVGTDDFTPTSSQLPIGAGPVPSSQMVLQGGTGWIVNVDRTVIGGARLNSGRWVTWAPPCSHANGPGYVAASSTSDLYALCNEGIWGTPDAGTTPNSEWLYQSTDGGTTFSQVGPMPRYTEGGPIAVAPGTATIVVVDGGLIASFDGGRSWQSVSTVAGITYVGFTTATQGVAISDSSAGPAAMLMTHDGGHTWAPVSF